MENTNPSPTAINQPESDMAKASNEGVEVMADIDVISQQLAEAEAKLTEMREAVLRERADLENQRKRLQRDLEQTRRYANERVLADLLPVCDSLERGLAVENADSTTLRAGIELTLKELTKVVEINGLKVINPLGEKFDPERHQAMSVVENSEQAPDTVTAVFQKGYLLNDRLLRPALVVIAKAPQI